jgi:lactate dehydrogenase-like 2-hydroxyacid dehydrogenase
MSSTARDVAAAVDDMSSTPVGPAQRRAQGRLVVLPHVGSATEATRAAMVDLAVDNLLAVLTGRGAPTPLPGTSAVPGRSVLRTTSALGAA